MYVKHLLTEKGVVEINLLMAKGAGFRPECSTIDNCLTLHHLITINKWQETVYHIYES